MASFPQVAEAVDTDGLGPPQLRVLAKVAANPRVCDYLEDAIELLVAQACSLDFDDLVIAVARWESLADEDGASDRHDRSCASGGRRLR